MNNIVNPQRPPATSFRFIVSHQKNDAMGYDREPRYLHPYIAGRLQMIIDAINAKLPQGHRAKLVYVHRSPDDQFKLFKQGRVFRNGSWIKVGPVVTHLDGFVKASRHNYIPVAISVACRHGTYSTTSWQLNDRYLKNHLIIPHPLICWYEMFNFCSNRIWLLCQNSHPVC